MTADRDRIITSDELARELLAASKRLSQEDDAIPLMLGEANVLATLAVAEQLERIAGQGEPQTVASSEYGVSDALRERIRLAADALDSLGAGYRADWSDFDGRTLRDQLGEIRDRILDADQVMTAVAVRDEYAEWARRRA